MRQREGPSRLYRIAASEKNARLLCRLKNERRTESGGRSSLTDIQMKRPGQVNTEQRNVIQEPNKNR